MARRRRSKGTRRSQLNIGKVGGNISRSILAGRDVVINLIWPWKWLLVIILGTGIVYATYAYGPSLYHWYKYRATDDEILILLADFKDESENANYDAAGSIDEALRTILTKYNLPDVRLVRINQTFERDEIEAVKAFGERYNATIFIWGYYDDGGMFPRFSVLRKARLDVEPEGPQDYLVNLVSPPDDFTFYVNHDLPSQITYFTQFTIGQIFFSKQSYSKAIALFEDAIKSAEATKTEAIQKSLASLYFNKGYISVLTNKSQQVIRDFTKVIELDPDNAVAYVNRGIGYGDSGNWEQAIQDYTKAIKLNSEGAAAYVNRGVAHAVSGDLVRAIQDYDRAIELDSDNTGTYTNRGNAYKDSGDLVQAIQDYTKAIELDPNNAAAYSERGVAYTTSGNFEQALQDFDKALELAPDDALTFHQQGVAYAMSGNSTQAIVNFTRAIELNPDYEMAYANRGGVYFNSGNFEQALQDFDKALELAPNNTLSYKKRGLTYLKFDNLEQAIRNFEQYLELEPNAPDRDEVMNLLQLSKSKLEP